MGKSGLGVEWARCYRLGTSHPTDPRVTSGRGIRDNCQLPAFLARVRQSSTAAGSACVTE